jgi:hypothetical protein
MGKIAGIFPIGDTGDEFVVAEWVPDPDVVAAELFKLANDTESWAEPLAEARAAIIYDTEAHFDSQADPYGKPWTALSPDYVKSKIKKESTNPSKILQLEGTLKAAAIAEDNWFIDERDITFNTENLPFYGPYHQAGTAPEGVAQILHKLRTEQELSREEVGTVISGFGRGRNLPQRMFIGLSDLAIAEVEDIFVNWLSKLVVTDFPLFGGGFAVRGPGGRFIKSGRGQ